MKAFCPPQLRPPFANASTPCLHRVAVSSAQPHVPAREKVSEPLKRPLLKPPARDAEEFFRRLPLPDEQQEFSLTTEFIKDVMENDKEPPPYFPIRRNIFLVKKKRDDADDGVGCSCKATRDVCRNDCECRVQSMSCSKDCKCSDKCCNKPFRKDKRIKVVKTERCGWGAVAAEAIKKDEFIIEYTGEVIDDAICEKRLWEMKGRRSICNFYMCEIAKDFIIDATKKGNASRYLNHSCQPNCRLEKWRVEGETRVGVFAGREIVPGEELTYDYKYVEFGPNVKCCCGAPNCRGAIGERFNSNRKSTTTDLSIKWGRHRTRSALAPPFPPPLKIAPKRKKRHSVGGSWLH